MVVHLSGALQVKGVRIVSRDAYFKNRDRLITEFQDRVGRMPTAAEQAARREKNRKEAEEHARRREHAKSFKTGDPVIADGRKGKVIKLSKDGGSIHVRLEGVRKVKTFAATMVTKDHAT